MRPHRLGWISKPLSKIERTHQGRHTRGDVDDCASSKIKRGQSTCKSRIQQSALPQTMCAIGEYTTIDHRTRKQPWR